ncbi:hypothetical protein PMAYCL1PPCAC_15164 [Pristionchus mayeri]|uniref:Uncharacterized protein n=1 Tax=Pristionchus mayeri TaxID=1317129 RepID=A0AAN5HXN5_9BILA|nr:hypothetical protein PMAYCL1PPCAC_15164 [Pristionchus mayeri]
MCMFVVLALLFIGTNAAAEKMQRQCLCTEFNGCYKRMVPDTEACADKCKAHVLKLGGDYAKVKECVMEYKPQVIKAMECVKAAVGDQKVCAAESDAMVPHRFIENLQMAGFREITAMFKRAKLLSEVTKLLAAGRGAAGCMVRCGQNGECLKKKCSLNIPSDNELVEIAKKCAMDNGLDTQAARSVCDCMTNAGIEVFKPLCPRLIVS